MSSRIVVGNFAAAQEAALSRMVQAGAVRLTTIGALLEWQRDWPSGNITTRSWEF